MNKTELINLIDGFKSSLISKATNGSIDEEEYKRNREILLKTQTLKGIIPDFIRKNRDADEFRKYMQEIDEHYAGRRSVIKEQMNAMIECLEQSEQDDDLFLEIQRYKQMEKLGNGGYGTVYRYYNECLDMDFAVKIYDPIFVDGEAQREGEKRFFREAKMLFSLNSRHIVRIYDAGRLNGKPYIRMELVKGYDLYGLREKRGNLDFKDSALVVLHILTGLAAAHKVGIIHRDLRPNNILYSETEKTIKIIDFGISAFLDTENHSQLTKMGECVAGGSFIDPLLQENPRLRDVRVDIYSVGGLWYFLLCGRTPTGSDMRKYLQQSNDNLKEWQIEMIMKCLSGNIEDRFSSCEEMIQEIKNRVDFNKREKDQAE